MTKRVEFTTKAGTCAGELAEPPNMSAGAKTGGVVVIQEWHGITDQIKEKVERAMKEGFVAIAPDLYHGTIAKDDDEANRMMSALDFGKAVTEIAGAVSYLREHPMCNGKIAVMGYCMGGALSFASACAIPGLSAVVPFYGIGDVAQMDLSKVTAPILAHFAKRDDWAKPEKAQALEAKLHAMGKPMELHVYDAGHAFMRDTDPSKYDAPSAKLAWERTAAFLKKNLA